MPELPWGDLPGIGDHVRLVLGRTVVREVDRFKSDGNRRRSKRARLLSSGLFKMLLEARGNPVVVRESGPRVDVVLSKLRPDPSATPDLDLSHSDDRIIAEAMAYGQEHEVTFFSHDTMALHTAEDQGVEWLGIPNEWLADPEPSPHQRQVEELERRVQLLEVDSPTINISLLTDPVAIHAVWHVPLSEGLIRQLVEEVKKRHPVKVEFHDSRVAGPLRAFGQLRSPSANEIEDYLDLKYPEWAQSVERGLINLPEHLSAGTQCARVTIEIENHGGAPAREAQVEFSLSEGLVFRRPIDKVEERLKVRPFQNPPPPPTGKWLGDHLPSFMGANLGHNSFHIADSLRHVSGRDPHKFYYKPVPADGDQWHVFECQAIRHRVEPKLFKFLIFAETDISGGKIACRVTASNLSEPAVAEFPIKVEYSEADSVETAREMVAQIGQDHNDDESEESSTS